MSYLKRSILFILIIVVLIVAVVLGAISAGQNIGEIYSFTSSLGAKFRPWRWSAVLLTIGFWPQLIQLLAAHKNLTVEQVELALLARWRVAAGLILFEFLIIEAVPAKLFGGG
jgi:hypothetical protein